MIVERSTDPGWLSNSFLVASAEGEDAVVIDAGAPPEPLLEAAQRLGLRVRHVLCTHHHHDHVAHAGTWVNRFGATILAHAEDRPRIAGCARSLSDGERVDVGGLAITALHVPGHTRGQLGYLVQGRCFTGDTLFAGSVGGSRAPGHGTFTDLRASVMERFMALPPETILHPGHAADTTVAREWERNPFVLAWSGRKPLGDERCTAMGEPATLLLWARDYDDGFKAWVRWADGSEDTVPGSRVDRRPGAE